MTAFYNEHDRHAAAWLRNLIAAGHISGGVVDERSVASIRADDLVGHGRVHLFAGIGGWDYALRLAGWQAARPVWTGSCPCQPFSSAGRRRGITDERHLWPEMLRLIDACRPPVVFGEQVSGTLGNLWVAGVYADLEAIGYRVPRDEDGNYEAYDLPAAGVGAPHIRQRLFWVADRHGERFPIGAESDSEEDRCLQQASRRVDAGGRSGTGGVADSDSESGRQGRAVGGRCDPGSDEEPRTGSGGSGIVGRLADPRREGLRGEGPRSPQGSPGGVQGTDGEREWVRPDARPGCTAMAGGLGDSDGAREETFPGAAEGPGTERARGPGFWGAYGLVYCRDGKSRRVEPGSFPLAHGIPGRVGRLRGYGNAIVPEIAAEFIKAYMSARDSE